MPTKKPVTKAKSTTRAAAAKPAARRRPTTQQEPVKAAKVAKPPAPPAKPRHPRGRVLENHGSKEALAKSLASALARSGQDADSLATSLKRASNAQLLRLSRVTAKVKQEYGSREKLIAAIGTARKKSKDKDYLAKLETYSLPQLLDLATSSKRAAAR